MATRILSAHDTAEASDFSVLVQRDHHGNLTATSLVVAEKFGKEHSHVLRDIEKLECSQEFRASNFGCSSYVSKQGKTMPMVVMTRDGFMFLAMGFTGKAAAEWKEKFIAAFNEMERLLIEQQRQVFALPPDLIEQQRRTDRALERLAIHQDEFRSETRHRLDHVDHRLESIETIVNGIIRRRLFGTPVMREWNAVIVMRYDGKCPCCQAIEIVDAFGRPISGVYEADHWRLPGHNKVGDGWPVCLSCNRGVLERDRLSKQFAFQHFHDLRKAIFRSDEAATIEQLRLWTFDPAA